MNRGFIILGDLVKISKGKKANNITSVLEAGLKRFIQIDDLRNDNNLKYTSGEGVVVQENDIIIAWDGANAGTIGYGLNGIIGSTLAALTLKTDQIYSKYLGRFLQTKSEYLRIKCTGATIPHISKDILLNLSVPIVPIEEQHRIVKILDLAQSLIEKRKQVIALLDDYIKAVFLNIFGDPVTNPKGWENHVFRDLCYRLSDGPFGSKLKTEHYSNSGMRVIRLQNIGIGKFKDENKSFIKNAHYERELVNYTCHGGDIVIATLGEPNIRACKIPEYIKKAVNKADCIHCIPNETFNKDYLVALLNLPEFHVVFENCVHGQTRSRISVGQLRKIMIPVPPSILQRKFSAIVEKSESIRAQMQNQLKELEDNFQAELQRVFRGE